MRKHSKAEIRYNTLIVCMGAPMEDVQFIQLNSSECNTELIQGERKWYVVWCHCMPTFIYHNVPLISWPNVECTSEYNQRPTVELEGADWIKKK